MKIYNLDITNEHCPMTFVKTRLKLSELKKDDILEVLLNEGEPLDNVPKSAEELGFEIVKIEKVKDNIHKVVIRK
jgi:TusA-related sulfurtransferase